MIKLITIDSQIWIYYLDGNAVENPNIISHLDGKNNDGIIFNEKILLNSIIPLEVAHNFFRNEEINVEKAYEILTSTFRSQNLEIKEISITIMEIAIKLVAKNRKKGIIGRDALILAIMEQEQVDTIVTHNKNILRLKNLRRIDPVFNPPLLFETGEEFHPDSFKKQMQDVQTQNDKNNQ